jgi:hypothetical protein
MVEEVYSPHKPDARVIVSESYDKAGELNERIVEIVYNDAPSKNTKQRVEFVRDDLGRVKEERLYGDDGTLVSTQKYIYDSQGKLTQKTSYRLDGAKESVWSYTYDDRGNEKEAKFFVADVLKARYLYAYDERGNKLKTTAFRGDGSEEYASIDKYDDKKRRTETVVLKPGGAVEQKHVYRYHDKGYLSEELMFSTDGSMIGKEIFSYKFDLKGNWIERTRTKWTKSSGKMEQTEIAKRTIVYYPQ